MKKQKKNWRAEKGGVYWCVLLYGSGAVVRMTYDLYSLLDELNNEHYKLGNYFQTEEQASEVAKRINKLFREAHEV